MKRKHEEITQEEGTLVIKPPIYTHVYKLEDIYYVPSAQTPDLNLAVLQYMCNHCISTTDLYLSEINTLLVDRLMASNVKSLYDLQQEESSGGYFVMLLLCLPNMPFEIISKLSDYIQWANYSKNMIQQQDEVIIGNDVIVHDGCTTSDDVTLDYNVQEEQETTKNITMSLELDQKICKVIEDAKKEMGLENWDVNGPDGYAYRIESIIGPDDDNYNETLDFIPHNVHLKDLIIKKLGEFKNRISFIVVTCC